MPPKSSYLHSHLLAPAYPHWLFLTCFHAFSLFLCSHRNPSAAQTQAHSCLLPLWDVMSPGDSTLANLSRLKPYSFHLQSSLFQLERLLWSQGASVLVGHWTFARAKPLRGGVFEGRFVLQTLSQADTGKISPTRSLLSLNTCVYISLEPSMFFLSLQFLCLGHI